MKSSGRVLDSAERGSEGSDWTRHHVTDPQRESGIPPARMRHPAERTLIDESDEHVQLALAESTRTEANLGSLLRGLQHLAAGASAARDANLALFHELEKVRELLGQSNAEERVLRQRLRLLEQTLECEKQDFIRDRASFIEQEDSFLAELLNDHERELAELRARLGEPNEHESPERLAPPRPSSRPPLRQKADPSTRPLVEYSLGKGEVRQEHLGAAQFSYWPRANR
jgi:hypothetical protein